MNAALYALLDSIKHKGLRQSVAVGDMFDFWNEYKYVVS